jgi:hypothetical protein
MDLSKEDNVFNHGTLVIEGYLETNPPKTFNQTKQDFEYSYFWQNPFVYGIAKTTLEEIQKKGLINKLRKNENSDTPCILVLLNDYPFESIPLSINNVRIFCNDPMETLAYRIGETEQKRIEKCKKSLQLTLMALCLSTEPLRKRT